MTDPELYMYEEDILRKVCVYVCVRVCEGVLCEWVGGRVGGWVVDRWVSVHSANIMLRDLNTQVMRPETVVWRMAVAQAAHRRPSKRT